MIYLFIIAVLSFCVRLLVWKKSRAVAIDQYFWVQYRFARQAGRGEIELPQYLLDLRQWYVPLFGRFIALLSDKYFRNGSALMLAISFARFGLIIFWGNLFVCQVSFEVVLAGGIVFLSSPITAIHDNQLNGRIGGALLFDLLLATGFAGLQGGGAFLFLAMGGLVCILFFLHKLSLQLYILCSFLFLPLGNITWLAAFLIAGGLCFILGYRKYALAHWDISSFWYRNRDLLSAHQIFQSPIYGDAADGSVGWKNAAFQVATLLGMCPWAILLILGWVPYWSAVCGIILLVAFCISFIPVFKCWGHGRNYTYFLIAPVIYGLFTMEAQWNTTLSVALISFSFGIIGLSIWQYLGWLKKQSGANDFDLDEVFSIIKDNDIDRICCLPFAMADQVACRTGRKVFWGGHGYGFKWLEPYFPVFRHPVERAIKDWNLGAILVSKSYWPEFKKQVDQSLFRYVLENDKYLLLAVKEWHPGNRIPDWALSSYPELRT